MTLLDQSEKLPKQVNLNIVNNLTNHMHIYQPVNADIDKFVEFWSQRYIYAEENLYNNNIGLDLNEQRIFDLFVWKNGTPLSEKKRTSVKQNYINRLDELQQFGHNFTARDFLTHFADGGAIWRIFWLHCYRPNDFPIYDQHVHRAMAFIENGKSEEIPQYDPRKIDTYIDRYLPFHRRFATIDGRNVDKALWAFGKFINENNFPVHAQNENC